MDDMSATRRFLVLHGLENHRPQAHWQWWLVDQLRRRGEQVLYPQMPNADTPHLEEWIDLLVAEWAQMGGGERIIVAHSMGCILWYEASARGALAPPANRVLLVAPPGPSFIRTPIVASFFSGPWKADSLGASSRSRIRLVSSDADPYCVDGPAANVYGQPLGLDAETIRGSGHITIDDGYGSWPAVLHWCLDPSTRFSEPDARPSASRH
jgi:uncharacterized protein